MTKVKIDAYVEKKLGIRSHARVLVWLNDYKKPATIDQITEIYDSEPGTVWRILKLLSKKGLVKKHVLSDVKGKPGYYHIDLSFPNITHYISIAKETLI